MMAGNMDPIHYTADEDSLYYTTFDLVAGYQVIADSLLRFSNKDFSDVVHKLDKSIQMFDEINPNDSARIKDYESAFAIRASAYYRSLGYEDYWDLSHDPSDTIIHLPPFDLQESE